MDVHCLDIGFSFINNPMLKGATMTDSDKRYLVEKVGFKIHEPTPRLTTATKCTCGNWYRNPHLLGNHIAEHRLDPDSPADLYGKIVPALGKRGRFAFCEWLRNKYLCSITYIPRGGDWEVGFRMYDVTLLKTDRLAQAMLEYFKEKENGN